MANKQTKVLRDRHHSTKAIYPKLSKDIMDKINNVDNIAEVTGLSGNKVTSISVYDTETKTKYTAEIPIASEGEPTGDDVPVLPGLIIGATEYKISGGKQLYQHIISVNNWNIRIDNEISTKLTFEQLREYLYNKGCTGYSKTYPANGVAWATDKLVTIFGCFASSLTGNISMVYRLGQSTYASEEITSVIYSSDWDKVSPL